MTVLSTISHKNISSPKNGGKIIQSAALIRQQIQERHLEVEKLPGVYCWWFPKQDAEKILSQFSKRHLIPDNSIQIRQIQGETYCALYFGISSDMSRRIRWHICGPFKSSTLRRTLRAIMAPNTDEKNAETIVNRLIDNCYWEWQYTDSTIQAEKKEPDELAQKKFAYPLNISKNNTVPSEWIAELKQMRSNLKK